MKFNASLVKTWMGCPLQAKFKEIENLPYRSSGKAVFGNCIHDALDQYNQGVPIDKAIDRFLETWNDPELLGLTIDYWPKFTTYGGLRKKGQEILKGYAEKHAWEQRTVIVSEHKFCVPFGEHEISGVVDLIELKKSTKGKLAMRIVDYKTNAKAPTLANLRLDIQFTTYVYASLQPEFWMGVPGSEKYLPLPDGEKMFDMYQDVARRAIWFHLWTNKEMDAGDRDDMDFMRLYRCINEISKAVEADIYVPNISGDTCTYCDFTDICPVTYPIYDKLTTEVGDDPDDEHTF